MIHLSMRRHRLEWHLAYPDSDDQRPEVYNRDEHILHLVARHTLLLNQ
jgi:hypothetical protein